MLTVSANYNRSKVVGKKSRELERWERRHIAARYYCQGWSQQRIADHIGCSQTVIAKDLKVILRYWKAIAVSDLSIRKAAELAKLDELERTYWEAWHRSLEDKEIQVDETTTGKETTTKKGKRREGQSGNAAYLAGIARCIETRCKIMGIMDPEREDRHGKDIADITKIVICQPVNREEAFPTPKWVHDGSVGSKAKQIENKGE